MSRLLALAALVWRYGLAGLLNTVVGFGVIMALDRGLGTPPALANATGYGVGTVTGFLFSRRFVFRSEAAPRATAPRYLLTVAAGFALNQAVLQSALVAFGHAPYAHLAAQLLAVGSYTVSVFAACRYWVFAAPEKASARA